LQLGVFVLNLSALSLRSWRLGGSIAFICILSSGSAQIAQRWIQASDPLQLRQFGGISRAIRLP
jgi:hypothetical protein